MIAWWWFVVGIVVGVVLAVGVMSLCWAGRMADAITQREKSRARRRRESEDEVE